MEEVRVRAEDEDRALAARSRKIFRNGLLTIWPRALAARSRSPHNERCAARSRVVVTISSQFFVLMPEEDTNIE